MPEYLESQKHLQSENYKQASLQLESCVNILKRVNQHETLGYTYLLKRLAYANLQSKNHEKAEQQLKECVDIMPKITHSNTNLVSAKRNLLLSYTQYDMVKANEYAESVIESVHEEDLPYDFGCILGNIKFFNGQIDEAKHVFKVALRKEPDQVLEG